MAARNQARWLSDYRPDPHAARNRNHGSVSSPRTIRSSVSTSTSQSTIITRRNNAPAVRHHDLDSTTARSGALLKLLRHDHCWHESGTVAKPPFAIHFAPGEQELVANPMPTRRRRCQPRSRKTLLDYPQLFRRRPSTGGDPCQQFQGDRCGECQQGHPYRQSTTCRLTLQRARSLTRPHRTLKIPESIAA